MKARCALLLLAAALTANAFPPAPPHTIFGVVRDELGQPLTNAKIIFETSAGVKITGQVTPNIQPSANYQLTIPMDAGLTADAYKPTALQPTAPFRIKVQINDTTYVPIQMTGDYSHLGAPSKSTRIDLTLGVDSDGDGLPDAWERALIAQSGGNLTLADIKPGDDFDGDGISNSAEYLAGTYAFDPEDGFRLAIAGVDTQTGLPQLDFLAIRSHTYTLYGSANLTNWTALNFKIPAESGDSHAAYTATDVRQLRVEPDVEGANELRFFKLLVQ